jgi:hypothetical protein
VIYIFLFLNFYNYYTVIEHGCVFVYAWPSNSCSYLCSKVLQNRYLVETCSCVSGDFQCHCRIINSTIYCTPMAGTGPSHSASLSCEGTGICLSSNSLLFSNSDIQSHLFPVKSHNHKLIHTWSQMGISTKFLIYTETQIYFHVDIHVLRVVNYK